MQPVQNKHLRPFWGLRRAQQGDPGILKPTSTVRGVLCLSGLGLPHLVIAWKELKKKVTLAPTQWKIQSPAGRIWSISLPGTGGHRADSHGHHRDSATTPPPDGSCSSPAPLAHGGPALSGALSVLRWNRLCLPSLPTRAVVRMATPAVPQNQKPSFPSPPLCLCLIQTWQVSHFLCVNF